MKCPLLAAWDSMLPPGRRRTLHIFVYPLPPSLHMTATLWHTRQRPNEELLDHWSSPPQSAPGFVLLGRRVYQMWHDAEKRASQILNLWHGMRAETLELISISTIFGFCTFNIQTLNLTSTGLTINMGRVRCILHPRPPARRIKKEFYRAYANEDVEPDWYGRKREPKPFFYTFLVRFLFPPTFFMFLCSGFW